MAELVVDIFERMKQCSYCGKEYGDEATSCSIDGQPLAIESPHRRRRTHTSQRTIIIWGPIVGLGLLCWLYFVDGFSFIPVIGMAIGLTMGFRRMLARRHFPSVRKRRLQERAAYCARRSLAASQKSTELSKASNSFSIASMSYAEAAQQAKQSGNLLQSICLHLYARLMLMWAGWLLGRSKQFVSRAFAELQRFDTILNLLGVKHDDPVRQHSSAYE